MSIEQTLQERSGSKCELCGATDHLSVYEVPPSDGSADQAILVCGTCKSQMHLCIISPELEKETK